MSTFKEDIHFLEDIERRQSRIWLDAADIGLEVSMMRPGEIDSLRDMLRTLLTLPGSKIEFKADKPLQRQYRLIIMWGAAGKDRYDASEIQLSYFNDLRKEFFSVYTKHVFTNIEGQPIEN